MQFKTVKGFRDFYPEQMAARTHIFDAWRRVSVRNGFVEYEGPMLEYLDLFRVKSGEGIVSELFSLTDRGGRELAICPEITPTLARMVNAKVNALPRPIKWFSIPHLCRAENPQKGRGREFFQWNVDVVGSDESLADAECIFTLIDLLAELGLTPSEAYVAISSRSLIAAALRAVGVADDRHPAILPILDKRDKVPPEAFAEMCAKAELTDAQVASLSAFQDSTSLDEVARRMDGSDEVAGEIGRLREVMDLLATMGASDYCRLDLHVVRGLAYYTGVVYEAFDANRSLRALAGGGRYDNLLQMLGGPAMGATGFGMGDMVLGILLLEAGKMPELGETCDCFVIDAGAEHFEAVLAVTAELRRAGVKAGFSYKRQGLGKQLKTAGQKNARFAAILGDELREAGAVVLKDMNGGEQTTVQREALASEVLRRSQG